MRRIISSSVSFTSGLLPCVQLWMMPFCVMGGRAGEEQAGGAAQRGSAAAALGGKPPPGAAWPSPRRLAAAWLHGRLTARRCGVVDQRLGGQAPPSPHPWRQLPPSAAAPHPPCRGTGCLRGGQQGKQASSGSAARGRTPARSTAVECNARGGCRLAQAAAAAAATAAAHPRTNDGHHRGTARLVDQRVALGEPSEELGDACGGRPAGAAGGGSAPVCHCRCRRCCPPPRVAPASRCVRGRPASHPACRGDPAADWRSGGRPQAGAPTGAIPPKLTHGCSSAAIPCRVCGTARKLRNGDRADL